MSSVMMATIGQLMRSGQRDEEYMSRLNEELNQLIQYWFGVRHWVQWRHHLPQLSQLIYYLMTTLSGLQTLGEEYVNIVQIDGNKIAVPKLLKRFVTIIGQIYCPFLISTIVSKISDYIQNNDIVSNTYNRQQLLKYLPIVEESCQLIQRVHTILFYLTGSYYYLSKRVTNIRYISPNIGVTAGTDSSHTIYKIVGYLTLSQLLVSLLLKYQSYKNSSINPSDKSSDETDNNCKTTSSDCQSREPLLNVSHRCSLCLEKRDQTTATTCGHLFCWKCITEWLQLKNECPLCRQPLEPSRIVLLNNYY
ncbi:peroxisome assembly protein 10-B-like [Oppia nitens]|uniref:peroxisome assembly protein 10-B-like n=1 Tax=Oppia nitens TaxID=1686743 RepID=UPI0023DA0BFF|nr:peroxisome assembly protein 10-B-like [Oppia nitens]